MQIELMWHWWGLGACEISRNSQNWMHLGGLFKAHLPIVLYNNEAAQLVGEIRPYHKQLKAGKHICLSDMQYTLLSKGFSGKKYVLALHPDCDAKEPEVLSFKCESHSIQCLRENERLLSAFPNPETPQTWWFEWDKQDKVLKQEGHLLALVFALLARERHWLLNSDHRPLRSSSMYLSKQIKKSHRWVA